MGHIQTGQENFTVVGLAGFLCVPKQSDPIRRFVRTIGTVRPLASRLHHQYIAVRQHIGLTRIIEILGEKAHLKTRRSRRHSSFGPADDFGGIAH